WGTVGMADTDSRGAIMLRSKRSVWIGTLIAVLLLMVVRTTSHAQDNNDTIQILGINTKNHPRIEITVRVVDSVGRPINGLIQGDFTVLEDGNEVPVTSIQSITDENVPLSIVLVIDTSRSMFGPPLAQAQAAANTFVDQMRDVDELALIAFDSRV